MARWLVLERCQFAGRIWDPESNLEKDRVYVGAGTPPEKKFRQLGVNEPVPKNEASKRTRPVALSQLVKTAAPDPQVLAANAVEEEPAPAPSGPAPVVDGKPVPVDSPDAPVPPADSFMQ